MNAQKVALITGSRRGIGLGIARQLVEEGFAVVLNGTAGEADAALRELQAMGGKVGYVQADISEAEDRQRLVDTIRRDYGRLDVLVNNAGVAPKLRADLLDTSEESFERLVRINLQGPHFLTQTVSNWMIEQKQSDADFQGTIVFVTSVSASIVSVSRGEYCISKAGLGMSAQLYAARLAEHGILVYEVRPGIIATDMTSVVKGKYDTLFADGINLQPRWGETEDVGKAVAMLCRGDLPYSTGQVIMVDGRMTVGTL